MDNHQISLYALIAVNVLFSLKGFNDRLFFRQNLFSISDIIVHKQYKRLLTSGFLHVDWTHLLFNMFALYSFGQLLLQLVGQVQFFTIYFVSLLGGNLLSLFINRHKGHYSAVGASGAVSGVIFACIAIYPEVGIYLFFIPIAIPGWVFGPAFILISIFGMKRQSDNIGHEAHLGGAIIGMLVTIALNPVLLELNPLVIAGILVPTIAFMIYLARKPLQSSWVKSKEVGYQTIDDTYNSEKAEKQRRMDALLDKANTRGWESLTQEEVNELDQLANGRG
jgi:membrane associated rhomboid family serine protease